MIQKTLQIENYSKYGLSYLEQLVPHTAHSIVLRNGKVHQQVAVSNVRCDRVSVLVCCPFAEAKMIGRGKSAQARMAVGRAVVVRQAHSHRIQGETCKTGERFS